MSKQLKTSYFFSLMASRLMGGLKASLLKAGAIVASLFVAGGIVAGGMVASLLLVGFILSGLFSQTPPSPQSINENISANINTNVQTATLKNGMEIVVINDPRAPVITHMVWYKVGAADDPIGKSGIAHYFEHLMFKGTQKIAPGEFSKRIAAHGGQDNAFTGHDYTAYYQRIASDKLAMVMEMEADRMQNLILTDAVTAAERDVVLEERSQRLDSNPAALLSETLRNRLHQNHPYHVPVIGWRAEIERLNTKDAIAFYRRFYAPDNALLVVVGDATMAEVLPLAKQFYGVLQPSGAPREVRVTAAPVNGPVTIKRHDGRVKQPHLTRLYRLPMWQKNQAREFIALELAVEILASGATSRLYKTLVRDEKIAVNIGGYANSAGRNQGEVSFYATPSLSLSPSSAKNEAAQNEKDMIKIAARIDDMLAAFKAKPVAQAELTRAKTQFLAASLYARDSQSSMARIYGAHLAVGRDMVDILNWDYLVADITAQEIQKAAVRFFIPANSVTGYLLPEQTARKKAARR